MSQNIEVQFPEGWSGSDAARKDVAEQIFYVSSAIVEFEFQTDGLTLTLSDEGDAEVIKRDAVELMQRCSDASKRTVDEVLEAEEFDINPPEDPLGELVESGQVHFNGDGLPVLEGNFLRLFRALDREIVQYADSIGCKEQEYGTTVRTNWLLKNGYLKSFPQHAMMVGTIHRDFESLNAIADNPDDYAEFDSVSPLISDFENTLSPTVCYHCFERHAGMTLGEAPMLITALGKCHRHEGKNTHGLTRLRTYTMREIIYFGGTDYVRHWQHEIMSYCKQLISDLRLNYRIVAASDPFFATTATQKKDFQRMFKLKYELQVYVPCEDRWVSTMSFNNHQKTLVDSYEISTEEEAGMESGCFGVGYERLAFAIVSQYGVDPSGWPERLRFSA